MTHDEFRAAAAAIAVRFSWKVDFQEATIRGARQIEAWFCDPAKNDVDTAQAYMRDGEEPVGLDPTVY